MRELQKRVADLEDPTRYLVVTGFGPRFVLYYNVCDDVYAMNEPSGGTLFKRRAAALAIKRLLGRKVRVVRCTTKRRRGIRVPVLPAKRKSRNTRRRRGAGATGSSPPT
jgi:hypothetical protein